MNFENVFCIWIGGNIPEKYLLRMNTTMTELFKNNSKLNFIIYTDNISKMTKNIIANKYELTFLKNKVEIKNIDILMQKYDEFDLKARNQIKNSSLISKNGIIIPNDYESKYGVEFGKNSQFEVRDNFIQWSMLYSSYLRNFSSQ